MYLNVANFYLARKIEQSAAALIYLKKANALRPNIFTNFVIMGRFRDCEQNMTDNNDIKEIYKMLGKVKYNEIRIILYIKIFWKELLNRKGAQMSVLSNMASNIDNFVSSKQKKQK